MPSRTTYPPLRTAYILNHQRNVPPRRLGGFPLNPKARLEQAVIWWRQSLRALPRHRTVGIRLTRWACDDHGSLFELLSVQCQHILNHQFAAFWTRHADLAAHVHDVKPNAPEALRNESL